MKILKTSGWFLLLLLVLFLFAWFSGAIGSWAAARLPQYLPYQAGKEFRIDRIYFADSAPGENGRIFISLSAARFEALIDDATPYSLLLPPGLIRDGLVVEATWIPWKRDKKTRKKAPMGVEVPVGISIHDTEGDHPSLTGQLPADLLSTYIAAEFANDLKEDREEWELGHYAYEFKPQVISCALRTTNQASLPPERYAEKLYLTLEAQADVKMKLEENIGTLNRDGRLSVRMGAAVHFEKAENGLIFRYEAKIRRVNVNIDGVNNIIDNKIEDRLKKKWQKSLNKEKRKKRLEKKPLPDWFPADLVIDVTFE